MTRGSTNRSGWRNRLPQAESLCMSVQLGTKYFVEQFPSGSCVLLRHFLDGMPDMDHHMVTRRNLLMLQEKQANPAFDTFRFASRCQAVCFDHPHRNANTHDLVSLTEFDSLDRNAPWPLTYIIVGNDFRPYLSNKGNHVRRRS